MLLIRQQQMQALEEVASAQLEDDLMEHCLQFFPDHYRVLGKSTIGKVVSHAIQRSRSHGFYTEQGIFTYFTLMLMLGSNFDIDIQLPWAAETLAQHELGPRAQIARLSEQAATYCGLVGGPRNLSLLRGFLRLRRRLVNILEQSYLHPSDLESYLLAQCTQLFPSKVLVVGTHFVRLAIRCGCDAAFRYGMNTQRGLALLSLFSFVLGSAFDEDPQFDDRFAILRQRFYGSPDAKIDHLIQVSIEMIDSWIYFDKARIAHVSNS